MYFSKIKRQWFIQTKAGNKWWESSAGIYLPVTWENNVILILTLTASTLYSKSGLLVWINIFCCNLKTELCVSKPCLLPCPHRFTWPTRSSMMMSCCSMAALSSLRSTMTTTMAGLTATSTPVALDMSSATPCSRWMSTPRSLRFSINQRLLRETPLLTGPRIITSKWFLLLFLYHWVGAVGWELVL